MFLAVPAFFSVSFNLVVAMATTRYCGAVERIPEHISVVIFVNSRVDSLMSGAHAPPDVRETFGIPKRGTSLYYRAMSETIS